MHELIGALPARKSVGRDGRSAWMVSAWGGGKAVLPGGSPVARARSPRAGRNDLSRSALFIKPHGFEGLVDVVAWADCPSFHVRLMRNDAVPPRGHNFVRRRVERVGLELAHRLALLLRVGLVQHLVVQLDRFRVLVLAVILGIDR